MRKEVLFAIISGVFLGVVIAFGVWRANVALSPEATLQESEETLGETTEDETQDIGQLGLTIAKPEHESVLTQSPIIISGITKASAWVSISTDDEDFVIRADESGTFEQEVELVGGVNQIVVTAFDDSGSSVEELLTLVYSTEFDTSLEGNSDDETQ